MKLSSKKHKRHRSAGFTLVELVVAMTLSLAVSGLVLGFFIDFWRSISALENDSETFVTRQNAGDKLRDALNPATNLINQNSLADANAGNPDPSDVSGTHWVLNHAVPATVTMPANGTTPLFYFSAPSIDSSRNLIMNGSQPYLDEYVLYINGSTKKLLLRTLKNTAASGNRAKTTCPAAIASTSCPADLTIAAEVSSVSVRYFSRSGNTIDYTSITDPTTGAYIGPDFSAVEVVELTVRLQRKATVKGGFDTKNETTIRVALRNG
jgi:type II secretory pathway pseudopilin PulG